MHTIESPFLPSSFLIAKMIDLLNRYYQRLLTREEAIELIPLVEKEWEEISKGKIKLADDLSDLLTALNGYAYGSIELVPYGDKILHFDY